MNDREASRHNSLFFYYISYVSYLKYDFKFRYLDLSFDLCHIIFYSGKATLIFRNVRLSVKNGFVKREFLSCLDSIFGIVFLDQREALESGMCDVIKIRLIRRA